MFFKRFQGRKTPNFNFSFHMKPFDIKIDRFSSQNYHRWKLSF